MGEIYISQEDRRKIVTRWIQISMGFLHLWAMMLVIAVLAKEAPSPLIEAMFNTCTFGIGATLAILLLDRASDIILDRFASFTPKPPVSKIETTGDVKITNPPAGENA